VPFVPLVASFAIALATVPATLALLREGGHLRENYRGAKLPFPAGIAAPAAAVLALVLVVPLDELAGADAMPPELRIVAPYALGVALLGLIDDVFTGPSRGWRGHGAAILGGSLSTGALKAGGSLGLALYALSGLGWGDGRYLLAVAVLVLATNLFNLLDLRPGRSLKAFVLLAAGVCLAEWDLTPLWAVGLFAAPLLVLAWFDLREQAMIGDTGSNLTGALAGLLLVLSLEETGLAVALAILLAVTLYGEFRSISAWVERTPLIRELDSLGRPS
jgi:UDP-N-acetylmuramyl pentapeptide phosphotransferase/UDP-N-acetylglucosamine-1-phosphate transferase